MEIGDIFLQELKERSADKHASFKNVTSLMVQRDREEVVLHAQFLYVITLSRIYNTKCLSF